MAAQSSGLTPTERGSKVGKAVAAVRAAGLKREVIDDDSFEILVQQLVARAMAHPEFLTPQCASHMGDGRRCRCMPTSCFFLVDTAFVEAAEACELLDAGVLTLMTTSTAANNARTYWRLFDGRRGEVDGLGGLLHALPTAQTAGRPVVATAAGEKAKPR